MKPVSDFAFLSHISGYEKELHILFNQEKISSAICSAISIMKHESNPENFFEENFMDEWLIPIYEWVSTNDGILNYLEERYEETKDDDDESWLYYIGETSSCYYKNLDEFKADLNVNMVKTIFKKCWERSCKSEEPEIYQFNKDFPELKFPIF